MQALFFSFFPPFLIPFRRNPHSLYNSRNESHSFSTCNLVLLDSDCFFCNLAFLDSDRFFCNLALLDSDCNFCNLASLDSDCDFYNLTFLDSDCFFCNLAFPSQIASSQCRKSGLIFTPCFDIIVISSLAIYFLTILAIHLSFVATVHNFLIIISILLYNLYGNIDQGVGWLRVVLWLACRGRLRAEIWFVGLSAGAS